VLAREGNEEQQRNRASRIDAIAAMTTQAASGNAQGAWSMTRPIPLRDEPARKPSTKTNFHASGLKADGCPDGHCATLAQPPAAERG